MPHSLRHPHDKRDSCCLLAANAASSRGERRVHCALPVLLIFLARCSRSAEIEQKPRDLTELTLEELMELEPRVYGASKFEQKATEAPSSVTVIPSDVIKRYGYRTLADILQSVWSFSVSYDRNYAFLGTRGINLGDFNSRILLLVDGHRINNDLTDGALIDTAFILDIDLIDRIEVIRGPGSVLYGNNAFFGVINVITRQANQTGGAEVSAEYASYDTYKGRVTYGKSFTNGVRLVLSGTLYDSAGADRLFYRQFNTTNQNNGVARDLDDDSFKSVFGTLAYRDFTLQTAFINREKGNPTAQFFTTFNDPRLRTIDDRGYVSLKYAHVFPDIVDVAAQVYYDHNDFEIGYPVGTALFKEKQAGEWWGAELQLNKRFWERHTLTVGAEYRDDFSQHRRIFDGNTGQTFTDVRRDQQNYGIYAQGDFTVLTNLHVNAGVRYDQYGEFDPTTNPRLALIYNAWAKSTFKAIYGTAFRVPNFLELGDPRFQDIGPEEITTYELVYEQGIGRQLRSSLSGFYNQMNDLIVFESGSFTNFDAEAKGVELAFEGFWTDGIRSRASYTYQQAENRSRDTGLPDSPKHLVKFNVSVPLIKEKVFAGLEFQYTSRRRTVYTTPIGDTVAGGDAAGFGVVNFTLFSRNLVKNLEFSASVYNVLDHKYGDPATRFHQQDMIERDGRTFRLKLTYRF
ncbi:MAG: TonB-dependent receptor [Verrucomicrobia bacterium]|nr:MAG: TonB-dependent receptor [Verrucomicrobiota bacterium]